MATEVKQRNSRVLVILGVVVAVAAGGLTLFVANRNSTSSSASGGPTVSAVYAQVAIPKGTKVSQDMLVVKQVPQDSISATTPTDVTAVVNKFTAIDVAAGSQLQSGFLLADQQSATAATLALQPLDIPAGHVALTIPCQAQGDQTRTPDAVCVGGLIQADDRIDMIIDTKGDGTFRYGFQDVHVLRAGGAQPAAAAGQAATPVAPSFLVIEAPRAQAEQITWLVTNKQGPTVIKYVLRPRAEYGKGPLGIDVSGGNPAQPNVVEQPVTPDSFGKLFPTK